ESKQAGKNLGWAESMSAESLAKTIALLLKESNLRTKISKNAHQILDGHGAHRVITSMREAETCGLRLRTVTQEDCRLL
ncbi:MAG: hypothetical protein ACFFCQ_13575, partial [Promethearchaeota archaeon]